MDLVRRLLLEPALDLDEEQRLARLARSGDLASRDVLVQRSLRLVALRVRALGFAPGDADDAFQVGAMALLAAVARFDPDHGARLATYAWPWITRALQAHRRGRPEVPHDVVPEPPGEPPTTSGPSVLDDLALVSDRERDVLVARFSRSPAGTCPTPWEEVARTLGLSVSTVRRVGDQALSRLRQEVGRVCDRAPQGASIPP